MMLADRFVSVSASDRKAWLLLYPRRVDSQVTRLGTYKTNFGRKRAVK